MQSAQRKTYDIAPYQRTRKVVKVRGNVAYINNDFLSDPARQRPKQQNAKKAAPAPRPVTPLKTKTAAKKAPKSGVASTLFVLFIAFCALALLVSRYAAIAQIGVQNNALQKQISTLEAKADTMAVDLELSSTLQAVQSTATQELGMTYPINNQKIYVDLNSG